MKRLLLAALFFAFPLFAQDKISLEKRVSPAPSGTQYAIPYATTTTTIGWLAHATGLQCMTQNGAAAPAWGSCGSGGGGGSTNAGTLWIGTDPNFATGTSYGRITTLGGPLGLVQLVANPLFSTTIADAKANPPTGWAWDNSSLVVAADANTTTANGLYISMDIGSNYTTVPASVPLIHRTTPYTTSNQDFLVRLASAMTVSNYCDERFVVYDQTSGKFVLIGFDASGNLSMGDGTYSSPGVSTTLTQRTNGVWLRLIRSGASFSGFYNLANQSTPPLTWTAIGSTTMSMANTFAGFYADRYNSSYATTFSVLYFDDQHLDQPEGTAATGFDSSSPVLTLVSGFDLGDSASSIADANVRLALAEITNPREWDTAAWTWSVSRGSSAPVSCGGGTYAAAASVTVGGTGRYLSVCGKAASDGAQPGSVNAVMLRIPFSPNGSGLTFTSPLTTKGDIHVYGSGDARRSVGADGTVLVADSTDSTGVAWKAVPRDPGVFTWSSQARTAGTVYQNTASYPMLIVSTGISTGTGTIEILSDASNPPTTSRGMSSNQSGYGLTTVAWVMPGHYYEIVTSSISPLYPSTEYVFTKGTLTDSGDLSGSRTLGTVYQNTSGKTRFVGVEIGTSDSATGVTDAVNPPTTSVMSAGIQSGVGTTLMFPVLDQNYYKVTQGGSASIVKWYEWDLGGVVVTRSPSLYAKTIQSTATPTSSFMNVSGKSILVFYSGHNSQTCSGLSKSEPLLGFTATLIPNTVVTIWSSYANVIRPVYIAVNPGENYIIYMDAGTITTDTFFEFTLE